ncbi:succinyldiaminopimelate transaminase [Kineobactrum sediminis]|uniref:Succinyldiaminopimelate transaminase n=1 Tax=Kineobactrum sediminis TaxID=1905677 RepID=A0A2N5Y3N1_9GAMM|nr:succinyldiaminopimelate transaminase [Kineobactrum sediminis]PLW83004.1 succinyldiaminopimelate transaminase [Kineobactrum sediminis]
MNALLEHLQPYPFEKLRNLFADLTPAADRTAIALSIGEPRHASPQFVLDAVAVRLPLLANYPATRGEDTLRETIAGWLQRRFGLLQVDPQSQVLPVNGTREALFAFAQATVTASPQALVLSPNPFYQIYEGAALLAGAEAGFINATAESGFLPDFAGVPDAVWQRCQLLYICTPGNPSGAVMSLAQLQHLVDLAERHDFIIASDECYSEIYGDEAQPPPGLLQACAAMGNDDYRRCVVFHSLSKRSNLPGLRSGFVAGDARVLADFLKYRTYHGCAMPLHHQHASAAAWADESHVLANRQLYREKFDDVLAILGDKLDVIRPDGGFYLWPRTPISDTEFARRLYQREHVTVVPGQYLARNTATGNPGENRVRMALVASHEDCVEAAQRIARCLEAL